MKTVSINLYSFAELSEDAKERAISDHEAFLCEIGYDYEDENGELVREYPEFIEDSEVIDSIEANEYLFFANGEMAHCVTYTGKHPKAGVTEFIFAGQTMEV